MLFGIATMTPIICGTFGIPPPRTTQGRPPPPSPSLAMLFTATQLRAHGTGLPREPALYLRAQAISLARLHRRLGVLLDYCSAIGDLSSAAYLLSFPRCWSTGALAFIRQPRRSASSTPT